MHVNPRLEVKYLVWEGAFDDCLFISEDLLSGSCIE